jgi:hypothetical protein
MFNEFHTTLSTTPRATSQTSWALLKNHAQDIRARDFRQLVNLYCWQVSVFIMLELSSRWIVDFGVTRCPREARFEQQLREATPFDGSPKHFIRHNDV